MNMNQTQAESKKLLRRKSYRKKKRYGGAQGSKERLRLKLEEVKQTCEDMEEAKAVLKEKEAHLRKENIFLKRYHI